MFVMARHANRMMANPVVWQAAACHFVSCLSSNGNRFSLTAYDDRDSKIAGYGSANVTLTKTVLLG